MRSGVIAQKLGMTRIFTDAGEHIPVTVLKLDNARLSASAPTTRTAIPRCSSAPARASLQRVTKAERGNFAVAKVEPKRKLVEFRVEPGQPDRGRRRDHRRPLRPRPVRRRDRHRPGQGLSRAP